MAGGARVPYANFCPVCGAKAADLQPETTLQIDTYNPWTCRACGHHWVMVAAGASLQGNWNNQRSGRVPLPIAGVVVGRLIRGRR